MVLRNSLLYLAGRLFPAVLQLAALALFSRLLTPSEYGRYAMIVAAAAIANGFIFQWSSLGVFRFLPAAGSREPVSISTAYRVLAALAVLCVAVSAATLVILNNAQRLVVVAGLLVLLTQATYELTQQIFVAREQPFRFGLVAVTRALVAIGVGTALLLLGWREWGVLIGVAAGFLLPAALGGWHGIRLSASTAGDPGRVRDYWRYGFPISLSIGVLLLAHSGDRLIIGFLADSASAGVYSVAYDLGAQSVTMIMMVVNMAAYPMVIRILDQIGADAARRQLRRNGIVLMAVGLWIAVCLTALAADMSTLLLGAPFRSQAALIIVPVSVASLLNGIRAFYFDTAFQLARRTGNQIWIATSVAVTGTVLNVVLVPAFGAYGAAWAALAASISGLVTSRVLGIKIFPIPVPWGDWGRLAAAGGLVFMLLASMGNGAGVLMLILKLVLAALAFTLIAVILDVGDSRRLAVQWVHAVF